MMEGAKIHILEKEFTDHHFHIRYAKAVYTASGIALNIRAIFFDKNDATLFNLWRNQYNMAMVDDTTVTEIFFIKQFWDVFEMTIDKYGSRLDHR